MYDKPKTLSSQAYLMYINNNNRNPIKTMKLFNIKIVVVLDDFFPCICMSLPQQGVPLQYTNLFSEIVFRRWAHTAYCPLGTGNSFPEGKGCISLQ
jgi:hypothetical protein